MAATHQNFASKEKRISLGVYPDVGLKEAREKRDSARKLLASGVDPGENRKAVKAAHTEKVENSFEVVTREWFAKFSPTWTAGHSDKIIRRMERDIFPWIGDRPIAEVNAPDLLSVLRRIEARGAVETAHRALQNCGMVFRYASPLVGLNEILPLIFVAPFLLSSRLITPALLTQRLSASC